MPLRSGDLEGIWGDLGGAAPPALATRPPPKKFQIETSAARSTGPRTPTNTLKTPFNLSTKFKFKTNSKKQRGAVDTQLITHDRAVYDVAWGGAAVFATAGADGSVRVFDLR